jgi:hypothetical protein
MQEILTNTGNPPPSRPIYKHLFNFINDVVYGFKPLSKTDKGDNITSEDDITQDLVDYLEDKQEFSHQKANYSFKFANQIKQGSNKIDIGIRLGRNYSTANRPFFCYIEAKRLPTPNAGKERDEREYVIVNKEQFKGNGGIQRFKENKYAPSLPYSIMIGYIQANDSDYWLKKVNDWITELINTNTGFWKEEDCLCKYNSDRCDRYVSVHCRKDNTPITLNHYWIDINRNNKKTKLPCVMEIKS